MIDKSALLIVFVLAPLIGRGEDRIWIEPIQSPPNQSDWYPGAIETLSGKVIDFDDQQLRYTCGDQDSEVSVAAARVIWIESDDWSESAIEAIALFNDRQYAESLAQLSEILQQRPPVWQQQWFTMTAAVAASRCGRSKISLELIAQLDRRPLPPLVVAWLPIEWRNQKPAADAVASATARLNDPSPLVQLVAASWLLSSPERSAAIAVLQKLKKSERRAVQSFAEMLSLRTATPPQVIESAQHWQTRVQQLPLVWQVGPTKTLIDKLQSAGLSDSAKQLQWSLELTPIHPGP